MEKKANLTVLSTSCCTLKCKLCATYSSTNPKPRHYNCDEMVKGVKRFFDCMKEVRLFTISGGEPFLHPKINEFIKACQEYTNFMEKFEIITNGTIVPNDDVLKTLSEIDKVDIMIDDYGPELSNNVDKLIVKFNEYGIKHRRRKYYGEDAHLGGWLDISDFSYKNRTENENDEIFHKCMYSNVFDHHYFLIDGQMFMCYVNHKLLCEMNEKENERVDILNEDLSKGEIKNQLINLRNKNHMSVCEYCSGFINDGVRFTPAEQL